MKNLYDLLVIMLRSGANIQTGSLLFTKGSAPQVPGAMAIFKERVVVSGTLGGGLLEAQAQKAAEISAKKRQNSLEWVDFLAEMEDQTGAICGGSALFLMDGDPSKHLEVYQQLLHSLQQRKSGALVTLIKDSGSENFGLDRFWIEQNCGYSQAIDELFRSANIDIKKLIDTRIPHYIELAGLTGNNQAAQSFLFIEPIHPIPQLIIAGAGHIGQALCKISSWVDFEITVLDDRPELAVSSRFPEASRIVCSPISEAFKTISFTSNTYIVIATQGHRTDMEALKCCIGSVAAYIGVIGSKRKITLMGQKFIAEKWATQAEWNFVHTPIGIDIHSRTVNEIAVSILAELIKERHEINFNRSKKRVCSIVLAAGKSSRMGQQKLLMPYKGNNMISTVVGKVANTTSATTLVVTGANEKEIGEALKNFSVKLVHNDRFEEGMLSSLQAGIASEGLDADGFLVLLGDQPMVSEVVINRLIAVFQKDEKGLLIPTFKGKRGHPVLISSKYKDEIKKLNPEIGLRELFLDHPDDILEIEVESEEVLKDIDTPEDYKREANL